MTTPQPSSTSEEHLEAYTRNALRFAISTIGGDVPTDDDAPFWEATGLDSLETYALVSELETRLGHHITDDMIGNWATQGDILRDLLALQENA